MAADLDTPMRELARRARAAWRRSGAFDARARSAMLHAMAASIDARADAIREANDLDLADAKAAGLPSAMIDRLALDEKRISAMAQGVRDVAELPDALGAVLESTTRPNGLQIDKVRVPLGVVLVIYESRPNVTADAAAICLKAGNAVILRGGKEAARSNKAILDAMRAGLHADSADLVQLVETTDRDAVRALLQLDDLIDLVIPRGGEGLIRAVAEHARMPVMKHYKGVCHVYVHADADLDMALKIAVNAKCQRPGVCNAMETLLVHERIAPAFLPRFHEMTRAYNLEIRGDEATRRILPGAKSATEEDWATEYLDQILSVRIVPGLEEAIEHIERYGSRHSDAIVTSSPDAAARFTAAVDSAAVYVNASTRFTDGAAFGKGAEIGISTDKLHARGPCGVEELTTYKYVVRGAGQTR